MKTNEELYLDSIAQSYPECYELIVTVVSTEVNPTLLIPIVRAISNLMIGRGTGNVQAVFDKKELKQVKLTELLETNQSILYIDKGQK